MFLDQYIINLLDHFSIAGRASKKLLAHPIAWMLNYLLIQLHTHLTTCTPKITRAGHLRYFLIFSLIKNDFLHFLTSSFYWELAF